MVISQFVDHEGFIWSFGYNNYGQLGTGNKTKINVPQKLQNIPPVLSVACGSDHTLMITNDLNLWSRGRNDCGQLLTLKASKNIIFEHFENINWC